MGLLRAGSSDGWRHRLYWLCNYKASFLSCFSSKLAKLDKLPVHVYEVDEEADKDEVGFLLSPASLLTWVSGCAAFGRRADLKPKQELGCLMKQRKNFFKIYFWVVLRFLLYLDCSAPHALWLVFCSEIICKDLDQILDLEFRQFSTGSLPLAARGRSKMVISPVTVFSAGWL